MDRIAAKKKEFTAMFQSGLSGARADEADAREEKSEERLARALVAQDFYKGALAAMAGRRPMSLNFLHINAQACIRGGIFNEGHDEGRRYLIQALMAQETSSAETLRPTGDEA